MDRDEYLKVFSLEREGNLVAAGKLLLDLAEAKDPHGLIELGVRYLLIPEEVPGYYCPGKNEELSQALIEQGRLEFERLAAVGDSEAMRMLGYFYLGLLGPVEKNIFLGERWLIKAFESGCYFAANDLATFYQGSDVEKAKYYYQEAEFHGCRVIQNHNLET